MLRVCALLLGTTLILACTSSDEPAEQNKDDRPLVPVYFTRDGYLVPELNPLPQDEPIPGLVEILATEPPNAFLRTELPADAALIQEAEREEGELVLDLNDAFWNGSAAEIRTRVAQVVFTLAEIEEGREVTLLEGSTPARVAAPSGKPIPQPFSADDFPGPRPLVIIAQPAPGATVPRNVPVKVIVPEGARAYGIVSIDEHLGSKTKLENGTGLLDTDVDGTKEIEIVFVVLQGDRRASVSVPVTVSG